MKVSKKSQKYLELDKNQNITFKIRGMQLKQWLVGNLLYPTLLLEKKKGLK